MKYGFTPGNGSYELTKDGKPSRYWIGTTDGERYIIDTHISDIVDIKSKLKELGFIKNKKLI